MRERVLPATLYFHTLPGEEVAAVDTRTALARAVAELDDAEAKLQVAQARVQELRTIRDGLQLAVERYDKPLTDTGAAVDRLSVDKGQPQEAEAPRPASPGTRNAARGKRRKKGKAEARNTDLALAALKEHGSGPTSTREVLDWTTAHGHTLRYDQVRGALSWLLETGRVERVAPATWMLPREEVSPNDASAPAADTAGAGETGENGSAFHDAAVLAGAGLNSQPAS
jgi:hypothetical protein